jgi:hypothetical protein
MDFLSAQFEVGIGCIISGTATYTVEHTFDDVYAPGFVPASATWFPNTGLTARTTNSDGNYAFPVQAIRLNVSASTGSVTMRVIQTNAPSVS